MQDLLVVGGGVIGMFCAAEAVKRGMSVTVISGPPSRPTASWAGGGILSPLFPWRYPDDLAPLTVDALGRYRGWQQAFVDAGISVPEINDCGLWAGCDDAAQALQWAQRQGVAMEAEDGGVFMPAVAAIRNPHLLKALAGFLQAHGVTVIADAVRKLDVGTACAHTDEREYRAAHLIIAAGAWSSALLPAAVQKTLPELFPAKGQMLLYPPLPQRLERILLTDAGYLIPRKDGRVLAGSTLEPGVSDMRPSAQASTRLATMAAQLWPALSGVAPIAQWSGLRPGASSPLPVITPLDAQRRTWLASGHFRNGLVAAPATAALLLDQIMNQPTFCEAAPYQSSPSSLLSSSDSF